MHAFARPPALRSRAVVLAALGIALLCVLETALRLGARSPDSLYVLPQFSLGYFWGTPLGWTGLVDGVFLNRDSTQFESLAAFLRDYPHLTVGMDGNTYTRMAGYSLLGSVLAPFIGHYAGFVAFNVGLWLAGAAATYTLAVRRTGSPLVGAIAALLVVTAPGFEALAGQALPYVASYGLFAIGAWFCERIGLFERSVSLSQAALAGLAVGASMLVYDIYMLPAFVVAYGWRRTPWKHLLLFLVAFSLPRLVWIEYWQIAGLPSYSHNSDQPSKALLAWFDPSRIGSLVTMLHAYGLLAAHALLNIGAAFLFLPVILAAIELYAWRRRSGFGWFVAVLVGGFVPAMFMLSIWPHIPRWYEYGFPAVYILAASALVRFASVVVRAPARPWLTAAVAVAAAVPVLLVSNLDVLGITHPMELLLFQPQHWSYLWSR